jgi:tetratricopeptide (TPR) repeat protein
MKKQNLFLLLILLSTFFSTNLIHAQEEELDFYCGHIETFFQEDAETIEICSDYLIDHPEDWKSYYYRALSYTKMKEYQKAVEDYSKSLEIAPDNFLANRNRGDLYFYIYKEYEKAVEDFTIYLDALASYGEEDDEIFFNRAMGYYYSEEFEKAHYDFQQLITSQSEAVSISDYLPISDCYVIVKDYENGITLLDIYIEQFPLDYSGYFLRGFAKANIGDYLFAIDDLSTSLLYSDENLEEGTGFIMMINQQLHEITDIIELIVTQE